MHSEIIHQQKTRVPSSFGGFYHGYSGFRDVNIDIKHQLLAHKRNCVNIKAQPYPEHEYCNYKCAYSGNSSPP